jgi:hypothetical protein
MRTGSRVVAGNRVCACIDCRAIASVCSSNIDYFDAVRYGFGAEEEFLYRVPREAG